MASLGTSTPLERVIVVLMLRVALCLLYYLLYNICHAATSATVTYLSSGFMSFIFLSTNSDVPHSRLSLSSIFLHQRAAESLINRELLPSCSCGMASLPSSFFSPYSIIFRDTIHTMRFGSSSSSTAISAVLRLLLLLAAIACFPLFVAAEITVDEFNGKITPTAALPGFNVEGGSVFGNVVNALNHEQFFFIWTASAVYERPESKLFVSVFLLGAAT